MDRRWLWGAVGALGLLLGGRALDGRAAGSWLGRAAALALVLTAAPVSLIALRDRRWGRLIASSAVVPVDEAVALANAGACLHGLFSGRLGAAGKVTSPGGVSCALYSAKLREATPDGRRGPFLEAVRERAAAIFLQGERQCATVLLGWRAGLGRVEVRRAVGRTQALSFERTAALGEPVLIAGRVALGSVEGSYLMAGVFSGPALLLRAEEAQRFARELELAARLWGAGALGLLSLGACVLWWVG